AEAKENHGLRFARMLGIQNMREQCFLTAAVQNMKRLVKAFYSIPPSVGRLKAHVLNLKTWALLMV
ncbi:MAG: transposase, partial [Clostridia bacterium]|nr:transposase [Clostridia bacterium]